MFNISIVDTLHPSSATAFGNVSQNAVNDLIFVGKGDLYTFDDRSAEQPGSSA